MSGPFFGAVVPDLRNDFRVSPIRNETFSPQA